MYSVLENLHGSDIIPTSFNCHNACLLYKINATTEEKATIEIKMFRKVMFLFPTINFTYMFARSRQKLLSHSFKRQNLPVPGIRETTNLENNFFKENKLYTRTIQDEILNI